MRKLLILLPLCLPVLLQAATPKLPPEKELKALVLDSLTAFNKAVQQKDFAQFYKERLSPDLRKQVSLEKFSETFRPFVDKGYDISGIAKAEPVFDVPPAFNSDDVLLLQGHYDAKPNKVTFTLKYVDESSAWKIIGINVRANPAGEPPAPVPAEAQLKEMVLDALLTFDQAVQTKDFGGFYKQISKAWQKETTPEELLKTFKAFVDQKISIDEIASVDPEFEGKPEVNDDGYLVAKGSYPAESKKVSFELKYLTEGGRWKLVGVNVQTTPSENAKNKETSNENAEDENHDPDDDPDDSE